MTVRRRHLNATVLRYAHRNAGKLLPRAVFRYAKTRFIDEILKIGSVQFQTRLRIEILYLRVLENVHARKTRFEIPRRDDRRRPLGRYENLRSRRLTLNDFEQLMRRDDRLAFFDDRRLLDNAKRQFQIGSRHDYFVVRRFDMATRKRNKTSLRRTYAVDALQNAEKNIPINRKFHPNYSMLRSTPLSRVRCAIARRTIETRLAQTPKLPFSFL